MDDGNVNTPTNCTSICGDGMLYGDEECDDGFPDQILRQDLDGCDHDCNVEDKYTCTSIRGE